MTDNATPKRDMAVSIVAALYNVSESTVEARIFDYENARMWCEPSRDSDIARRFRLLMRRKVEHLRRDYELALVILKRRGGAT